MIKKLHFLAGQRVGGKTFDLSILSMAIQRPEAVAYNFGSYKQVVYVDKSTGAEVVEVCNPGTGHLVARKERHRTMHHPNSPWIFTYGKPVRKWKEIETVQLSVWDPFCFRQDTSTEWSWRIEKLSYEPDNYQATVDREKNQIVVFTINRKYIKKIDAPNGETLSEVKWTWRNRMLLITHTKPSRVVAQDREDRAWRLKVPIKEEEDVDCPTQ
jgi:hypothetical protein